jgi:hypothetical protein
MRSGPWMRPHNRMVARLHRLTVDLATPLPPMQPTDTIRTGRPSI